jgi:hypothetical protein
MKITAIATVASAAAAAGTIAAVDGARIGLVAACAGGAVAATRARFAGRAAAILLAALAILALTGHGMGSGERTARAGAKHERP